MDPVAQVVVACSAACIAICQFIKIYLKITQINK